MCLCGDFLTDIKSFYKEILKLITLIICLQMCFKFTFKNTKAVFSLRILFFLRTLCQTFRTGHWSLTMGDNL